MLEVTNSEITNFKACRYRWFLSYIKLLTPKAPRAALEDGSIFHDCLEMHYNGDDIKIIGAFITTSYRDLIKELMVPVTPDLIKDYEKRKLILQAMVFSYIKHWEEDKSFKVIETESEFNILVESKRPKITFRFRGKRDLNLKKSPYRFIMEHKSTGTMQSSFISQLEMSPQMITYLWADWQENVDDRAEGIIINACFKSKLRQGAKETKEEYLNRVIGAYSDSPEKHFFREELRVSLKDLKRFQRDAIKIVRQMERATKNPKSEVYRNESECYKYGPCPYLPICKNRSLKGSHMEAYYTRDKKHMELDELTKVNNNE